MALPRIAHITTVHSRGDTRIVVKEMNGLVECLDAEVALFVQDGNGNVEPGVTSHIRIVDTGPVPKNRVGRFTRGAWAMYKAVRNWRPDIVHFHDPELIGICVVLRLSGIKIIYDVHEDLPRQILAKHYLNRTAAAVLSTIAKVVELIAAQVFSAIIAATPVIAARFPAKRTVTVRNYPKLSEFEYRDNPPYASRPVHFAYVGGVTEIRGGNVMIDAIEKVSYPDAKLVMAGGFTPDSYGDVLKNRPGWSRVCFRGWVGRSEVAEILSEVRCGIVTLQPTLNYLDSMPVKMFEYMAAGLPVIASDFPLWRQILEEEDCGLFVDPTDPAALADALDWIIENPLTAENMGKRGREKVLSVYNWAPEQKKMIDVYTGLLRKRF